MYINTNDKNELKRNIECLLDEEISLASTFNRNNLIFFEQSDIILRENLNMEKLDKLNEIKIYHYTRRLTSNGINKSSKNLFDLLTSENSFTHFLNERGYTFKKNNKEIRIFYDLKEITKKNNKNIEGNLSRFFGRLGQCGDKDYAINGFIFEDGYKQDYKFLENCPEFIQDLSKIMNQSKLVEDYKNSSKYFCLSYRVSFEDFIFDDGDPGELRERKIKFLKSCINYISKGNSDYIIRLLDHKNLKESQLIECKEII